VRKNNLDLKVLVVEDSRVAMRSLCSYLVRMGIGEPLKANSGQAALEIFKEQRPDIVLLDAMLPDIDGFEVAQQIRSLEKSGEWTAIIFLTVLDKDKDMARGIEAGGDDYLKKPVSETVLKAKMLAMRRLVESHRSLVKATHDASEANRRLQRLSTTDKLTGIANRHMFDELLKREWRRCERMKQPVSLIMVDADYFKQYNDTYGHQAGDACLKAIATQVSRAAPRATDLAARYGGEEFVLVLGETTNDGATWVANNIRQHVADLRIPHTASKFGHVTVSCGLASHYPHEGRRLEDLILAADKALYSAKSQGRNMAVCAEK
jgi:diguanylate cyclase (GGDEF)-like protein